MHAQVLRPYRDRETMAVHYAGEVVELSHSRYLELQGGDFVEAAELSADEPAVEEPCAAPATAGSEGPCDELTAADGEAAPADADGKGIGDMTVKELQAAISAAGGFAPKKANKAELVELYRAL